MRRLKIDHVTEYRFGSEVTLLPHRLLLRPRESHDLRIVSSVLAITPSHRVRWQRDSLDNSIAVASFSERAALLRVESQVIVEHYGEMPLDFLMEDYAVAHPFAYGANDAATLAPFRVPAWPQDLGAVGGWLGARSLGAERSETLGLLMRLNLEISRAFRYQGREEPGVQSPARTLTLGSGSCRDFAALFVDASRQLGLAARFVSGYHINAASEAGAGATHAWAEVYLPGAGWKGFDPTGGVVTGSDHIAVAVAYHAETVPPVAGSFLGPAEPRPLMDVRVRVGAA